MRRAWGRGEVYSQAKSTWNVSHISIIYKAIQIWYPSPSRFLSLLFNSTLAWFATMSGRKSTSNWACHRLPLTMIMCSTRGTLWVCVWCGVACRLNGELWYCIVPVAKLIESLISWLTLDTDYTPNTPLPQRFHVLHPLYNCLDWAAESQANTIKRLLLN